MTTNVAKCIREKARQGQVNRDDAQETANRYEELLRQTGDNFAASERLLAEVDTAARQQRWTRLNQLMRQAEALQRNATEIGRGRSGRQIAKSYMEFLAGQQVSGTNVFREIDAVQNNAHAIMADAIQAFKPRFGGLGRSPAKSTERGAELESNIIREKMGESTGDEEAQRLAKAIGDGLEYLRTEFNRSGGNIAFRENYMPQLHESANVRQVSKNEWIETIMPMLDREAMVDMETGEIFDDARLREVLDDTYETIVSNGLNDLDPERPVIGQGLTTRHQNRRFLQFKDADSWLAYHRRFGPGGSPGKPSRAAGNAIFSVFRHVETMARDTGALRVLGPDPVGTMRVIAADLQKRTDGEDFFDLMQNNFREATGKVNIPTGPSGQRIAGAGIATRNVLQSAILGQAFLSALTDVGFSQTAARFTGLPQMRLAQRQLSLLNPTSGADRRQAIRLGLGAEGALEQAQAAARVSGESLGDPNTLAGATRSVNDAVMRASLLQPWTEGTRWAFGTEMLATLTERAGQRIDEMEQPLRNMMERNGIDEATWDAIRNAPKFVDPETGADFIRPIEIMQSGNREAANALQRMISTETEFAVPTNFVNSRAFLRQGTRAGTSLGELSRFASLLKNFPVTVMMLQWGRQAQAKGGLNKLKYNAMLLGSTGAMGVLAEQLATISDGQQPKPMTGEGAVSTMADGLWRAGTFGLMGDIVLTNFDEFGSSLTESLAGPAFGVLSDAQSLSSGNAFQALTDPDIREDLFAGKFDDVNEETNFSRDLLRFAEGIQPGGTLWWAKTVQQRLFWDELQKMADPEFQNSFQREEQVAEDENAEFFFAPGNALGELNE